MDCYAACYIFSLFFYLLGFSVSLCLSGENGIRAISPSWIAWEI